MSGGAPVRDLVVAFGERWWQAMLDGSKRFDVRRRWAHEHAPGQRCWVYSGGRIAGFFAAALLEEGASREAIAEATGVRHPFPLGKLADQAAAVGRPAAEDGLRAAEAADHAVKTGRGSDALALELLIVRLGAIGGSRSAGGGRAGSGSMGARS